MPSERISMQNFLRASEIFLQEHDNYSAPEQALLQGMVRRLSANVIPPPCKNLTMQQSFRTWLRQGTSLLDRLRSGEQDSLSNLELELYRRQLEILNDGVRNLKHAREIRSAGEIVQKLAKAPRLARRSTRRSSTT